ncbi:hypothetical protein MJO28_003272 [Puccinia striiformis f. sp. tritici]|uniref:Uncharacterized protein n=1 Tax=Puccinia striiformis f. sp. tritici TaxID=168172 RepID=A0ACC0ETZ0_9BASI|nr:hypothetical protein Pst134EB_005886 [Puccinia striiformis f. sp. tritici]KAI7959481.1 hypothetical protein MJO28_003272 [Puccinia striiformis f. sp. tritici]KAI7965242.1 hypothetical protein MJO29_003340 [Puccinia striiformis f. sp. tritici]
MIRRILKITQAEQEYHKLIKQAIQAKQDCRIKNSTRIPSETLAELWTVAFSHREPPIDWIKWLYQSTIKQEKQEKRKLNRFISLALGILIRNDQAKGKLTGWLEDLKGLENSNELEHRRLQIKQLLENDSNNSDEFIQTKDPYILSTLLRSSTEHPHQLEEVFKNIQGGTQQDVLSSIRVSSRSNGQLIHRTSQDSPFQALNSTEFKQILSDNQSSSSTWKTGLILSQAETLVGQIKSIIKDYNHQSSSNTLTEILQTFQELLELRLNKNDKMMYGGKIETNRLIRRQTEGLETILEYLLLSEETGINFGIVLELIEGIIDRFTDEIIRTKSWKLIISSHLKLSTEWSGENGLKRLFELLLRSSSLPPYIIDSNGKPCSKFKKIMPGDIGLTMIERVLFPQEDHHYHHHSNREDEFEKLIERIQLMNKVLKSLGSPRRFRDHRLKRLIFLSVQKRINLTIPIDNHHEPINCLDSLAPKLGDSLDWWNRADIWRDLEDRLSAPVITTTSTILDNHQLDLLQPQLQPELIQEVEEDVREEEFVDLHQLQLQFQAVPSIDTTPNHHHHPGEEAPQTETDEDLEASSDHAHQSLNQDTLPQESPPHIHKSDQLRKEPTLNSSSLDAINSKLRVHSRDYFDQHSLLTCLVHIIRNKFR